MAAVVPSLEALLALPKVELHLHLDGSCRHATLHELARTKGLPFAEGIDVNAFKELVIERKPNALDHVLQIFIDRITPAIKGNLAAVSRIAYELCDDLAEHHIVYAEVRYSPHLFAGEGASLRDVVLAVNEGLSRGAAAFGVKTRTILCCIRPFPEWSDEVVELAKEFAGAVVGIDLAASEAPSAQLHKKAFLEAERHGIHRTAHAGEGGPASNVAEVVNDLHVERVGHGYHILDDDALYAAVRASGVHFECCPTSSLITGSVASLDDHPIIRFQKDGVSSSINSDDPRLFDISLTSELRLMLDNGLTQQAYAQSMIDAAQSCFLPTEEKAELVTLIKEAYAPYLTAE